MLSGNVARRREKDRFPNGQVAAMVWNRRGAVRCGAVRSKRRGERAYDRWKKGRKAGRQAGARGARQIEAGSKGGTGHAQESTQQTRQKALIGMQDQDWRAEAGVTIRAVKVLAAVEVRW